MLLARFLKRLIKVGRLDVIDADDRTHVFAGRDGPTVTIRLHDRALHWKLFVRPDLYAGEAYMDGLLTIEDGSVYDFLDLVGRNVEAARSQDPFNGLMRRIDIGLRRLQQFNPSGRAQRNVAHHYDLSGALYRLFLDSDQQYSCAYFLKPEDGIDLAQAQKRRHIAAKLLLEPGMSVLDIGSGWGGLALYLAQRTAAHVTGITLSREQHATAEARARTAGLSDQVSFSLRDYREQTGTFDRIVSVGMFEHVGVNHYDAFFAQIHDRLAEDGVALLHTIGRVDVPGSTNPWLRKYIFPGGYSPALSEVMAAVERAGLWVTDVEILRLHYAHTLRQWRQRFLANRRVAAELYDERFCRMWEFYLAAAEISFRYLRCAVFQIQLARRQEAVPLTRDYIVETERALAADEDRRGERAA
ncbi:MAG TPA: cyclopropane-fatty-acyl-phospholipid synthase family protein [Rhodospirillales bacterium]|jgi:cyclopropane-fatty-acyl-phospholipid synthase|nr:cyclopropane-fatty-acyl-phospholipid synthase family protein [Rhodospirillales bacterium]